MRLHAGPGAFELLEARHALAVRAAPDVYSPDEDAVLDLAPMRTFVPRQAVWNYTTTNGDPALVDPDFYSTWHTQGMSGGAYDGPPFAYGLGAFEYGTVDGLFGTIGTSIFASLLQIPGVPQGLTDTAYFVTTLDFDGDPAQVTRIVADVLADDGAVFYLNGEEVGRINMGDQPDTFAARAAMPTEEWHFSTAELANRFVGGTNDSTAVGWPIEADGDGHSLVIVDPNAAPAARSDGAQWRASTGLRGSPGELDAGETVPWGYDDAIVHAPIDIVFANGMLADASDAERQSMRIVILEYPAHGALELGALGVGGSFMYLPDRNFF